jgi:hypothetical protein
MVRGVVTWQQAMRLTSPRVAAHDPNKLPSELPTKGGGLR